MSSLAPTLRKACICGVRVRRRVPRTCSAWVRRAAWRTACSDLWRQYWEASTSGVSWSAIMDAAGAAAAVLARTSRRREAITPVLPLAVVLLFLSPLRESAARLPMVGRTSSMQCTEGTEKSGSGTTANWPTYHFMNNVTKDASGALLLEPLNDANAIAEYKGVYHVMMQEGGGNWSHGVSNDMVRWYLIEDALDSGPKSIGFPDVAPCDGSLSFPDLGAPPFNGSAPVIVYDAACGIPLAPPQAEGDRLRATSGDDVDRLEVARPSDPSDPYLRSWTKTLPGPIKFVNGSPPCAFPSRVWKSESAAMPTWNMLCNIHGGDSWARFISTTPTLMEWKLADKTFTIPPVGGYDNTEGGEMFLPIPNPLPGGNTHMITGQNIDPKKSSMGSVFYLGNYSRQREKMILDVALGPQTIEYGFVDRWAVANYVSDGRLVTIGWLRRPDTLHAPCAAPIHGIPHSENRFGGCENSVASLVRELRLDQATGQLISRPIAEYTNLHTEAFVDKQLVVLPAVNGSATTLQIPPGQGGSLDIEVTFDLSTVTSGSDREFGVALRSSNSSLSAALTLYFSTSGPDADGTHMVRVRTTQHLRPSVPAAPLPLLPVLTGERLTIRALIDRPYIEVFLMDGRIAFVVAPDYDPTMTAVRLFNGWRCPAGTEPSNSGCLPPPPKPRCTYHADKQLYDPGSKHTLAPVAAADEAACCVKCMESEACYGAELYGGSCYLKTAKLPLVNQTPPKGVALVACVKNQSLGYTHGSGEKQTVVPPSKLVANVTVHGMACGWRIDLPKPRN